MVARHTSPHRSELLAQRAGRMRAAAATSSEQLLWQRLRGRQLGVSFKRQVPVGGRHIVDFFAPGAHLVIEVDGSQHLQEDHMKRDQERDEYLAGLGLTVLRFDSRQVLTETAGVVEVILRRIKEKLNS